MKIFTEPIPSYGYKITIKQWFKNVAEGDFIDYDGFGAASNGKLCTKKRFYSSQKDEIPKGTTHIIWFNR